MTLWSVKRILRYFKYIVKDHVQIMNIRSNSIVKIARKCDFNWIAGMYSDQTAKHGEFAAYIYPKYGPVVYFNYFIL